MNLTDLSHLFSYDIAAVAVIFVLGTFIAWRSGSRRLSALVLAGLVATPFIDVATHAWILRDVLPSLSPLVAFAITFALLAFFFDRLMRGDITTGLPISTSFLGGFALTTGLVAVWANTPALTGLHALPVFLTPVFAAPFLFWWFLASLALLLVLSR